MFAVSYLYGPKSNRIMFLAVRANKIVADVERVLMYAVIDKCRGK